MRIINDLRINPITGPFAEPVYLALRDAALFVGSLAGTVAVGAYLLGRRKHR